ncbi:nuclear GTP-binding protein nug1 [Pleosporales sp. CAS-2024a]
MKVGKPKSKRVPVRLRNKIEKASAAKQRKAKKLAKKNPEWRSKTKKDPGIPNLFPYKDKILAEVEETRRRKEDEALRRRELAKEQRLNGETVADAAAEDDFAEFDVEDNELLDHSDSEDQDTMDVDNSNPMAALLASAKTRAAAFDKQNGDDNDAMDGDEAEAEQQQSDEEDGGARVRKDLSRKQFDKVYKQVVDAADVVLYVLDARDPTSTRSKEVEQMVMAADGGSKRMIFILNKIDLVPPPVLRAWLVYLRRSFPTIPLRASKSAPNAKTFEHKHLTIKGTSETLFKALKSFAESRQMKRSIKVGIIGYPNVGKSSVINALGARMGGRGPAAPVGAEAGVTTSLREVKLDNKLKLLDSPGIVFPNAQKNESKENKVQQQARLILLNAVPPKEIDDPIPTVSLLLKRLSSSEDLFTKLMDTYDLPALHSVGSDRTTDFLVQVARKRGRLGRGGVANLHSAAHTVLTDWRDGRIQGWTSPPKYTPNADETSTTKTAPAIKGGLVGDQKEIVKEWATEFKLEGLWGDEPAADDTTEAMEL